jgi:phosphoenolpyruvate carboxylase
MAKADLSIAARYAELVEDAALRDRVFSLIVEEFERTRRVVLRSPDSASCSSRTRCSPARSGCATRTSIR